MGASSRLRFGARLVRDLGGKDSDLVELVTKVMLKRTVVETMFLGKSLPSSQHLQLPFRDVNSVVAENNCFVVLSTTAPVLFL